MKRALPFLLLASVLALPAAPASAQDPAPPPPPPPQGAPPPPPDAPPPPPPPAVSRKRVVPRGPAPVTDPILSRNYSVRLKLTNGEQASEFTLLTASPTLSFNGSTIGEVPEIITFSGTLVEENEPGKLTLTYSVGGRIPFMTPTPKEPPVPGIARVVQPQIQYSDETSTGAIHVSLGKTHTLFKNGARSYAITITEAEERTE